MPVIRHKFQSTYADPADATLIRPSNWNDTHSFSFATSNISVNTTLDNTYEVVFVTSGVGGVTITLPNAVGITSAYYLKKVDSGTGAVTINTTSSQTIDGNLSYSLINQYQFVTVVSDGSNWQIIAKS